MPHLWKSFYKQVMSLMNQKRLIWTHHSVQNRKITQQSKHVVTKSINTIATLLSPQNEVKFLVFRSHLLSLYTSCRSCHQMVRLLNRWNFYLLLVSDTLTVTVANVWLWNSQLFIKNMPAGNICYLQLFCLMSLLHPMFCTSCSVHE